MAPWLRSSRQRTFFPTAALSRCLVELDAVVLAALRLRAADAALWPAARAFKLARSLASCYALACTYSAYLVFYAWWYPPVFPGKLPFFMVGVVAAAVSM